MTTKSYVLKLPEELHRAIETRATADGRTVEDMAVELLRRRLDDDRNPSR